MTNQGIQVGDWVKTGPQRIYEIVEIRKGKLLWCSDSLAEINPEHIQEVRSALLVSVEGEQQRIDEKDHGAGLAAGANNTGPSTTEPTSADYMRGFNKGWSHAVETIWEHLELLKDVRSVVAASAQASHFMDGLPASITGKPAKPRVATKEDLLIQRVDAAIKLLAGNQGATEVLSAPAASSALNASDLTVPDPLRGHDAEPRLDSFTKYDLELIASIIADVAQEQAESEDTAANAEAPILRALARKASIIAIKQAGYHATVPVSEAGSSTQSASVQDESHWLPIETAPKDVRVLVANEHGLYVGIRFSSEGHEAPFYISTNITNGPMVYQPTHWRSLPAPPEATR